MASNGNWLNNADELIIFCKGEVEMVCLYMFINANKNF